MSETADTKTRPTGTSAGEGSMKSGRVGKTPNERAWMGMLRGAAKFTRNSARNVLLLCMQAEQRGGWG